jgi:hypothetical protein
VGLAAPVLRSVTLARARADERSRLDDAMGWMWGDLGALFVYLSPLYLKVRWFQRADARIDGH